MEQKQHPAISRAKEDACRAWPRAVHPITSLVPYETENAQSNGHPTMMVDRWYRLYYHPEVVKQDRRLLTWSILHEVCHPLFQHWRRAEAMFGPMSRWDKSLKEICNTAGDLAINPPLRKEAETNSMYIMAPEHVLYPEQFDLPEGKSFDYYLGQLLKDPPEEQQNQGDSGDASIPGTQGHQGASASGSEREWELGRPDEAGDDGEGDEQGQGQGESQGEGQGSGGVTPEEQAVISQDVAKRETKGCGTHGLDSLISDDFKDRALNKPRENPFNKVAVAVARILRMTNQRGQGKRSYRRISRRSPPSILLPTSWKVVPDVTLVIDTSGSMYGEDLELAKACVKYILHRWPRSDGIRVVVGDTSSRAVQIGVRDGSDLELRGGGGTHMGRIIESTISQHNPDVIIVATDGYTPWCSKPAIPVIVAMTNRTQDAPNWATTVRLA